MDANIPRLALKKSPFPDISMFELVQQISGKKIATKKFPAFLENPIVFPPKLNLEQTSSESTAIYKSSFLEGNSYLDLTTGFGIDAFFMSKNFKEVYLVEQNQELVQILEHNFYNWNKKVKIYPLDLHEFIKNNKNKYDIVYLDPARRNSNQKKVFLLEDLSPNIIELETKLLEIGKIIITKLSPLIDITYLRNTLSYLSEIHIIAIKNEVKEVVVFQNAHHKKPLKISAVNLETNDLEFIYYPKDSLNCPLEFSLPLNYIYIPNNAILKSGAFNILANEYELKKLDPNTHIFTSSILKEKFPGRVLKMELIDAKNIKKGDYYNIVSKNYPLTPEQIKKKYKLKDGGENYLIFTQSLGKFYILQSV